MQCAALARDILLISYTVTAVASKEASVMASKRHSAVPTVLLNRFLNDHFDAAGRFWGDDRGGRGRGGIGSKKIALTMALIPLLGVT